MKNTALSLIAAALVSTFALFGQGCATDVASSGIGAWGCTEDRHCDSGEYCAADGYCEASCEPGESQCPGGFFCSVDTFQCEELLDEPMSSVDDEGADEDADETADADETVSE